jgi:hypothetical protein
MALSLIFGKKYAQGAINNNINNSLNIVTFDTMMSEEHKYTSRITSYPVESGTVISDHILNLPDTIVLTGLISDTPLNIFATFNRSVSAFNALVNIHETREVVQVITGLKVYDNMALVNLDVPRTIKTGQTLSFTIEFQKIVFSNVLNVPINATNVFAGSTTYRSSNTIASNQNIPYLQNDPVDSLKDQASSTVNIGIQSQQPIPNAVIPNVSATTPLISGVQ